MTVQTVTPASGDEALGLSVRRVSHSYAGNQALDDISFDVEAGRIAALLGPSGCGKSTLLRAIAGLIQPDSGTIRLGGQDIAGVPARDRRVGMVFQNYALFPHMTVGENVGYGLSCQRMPRDQRRARVDEVLRLVRLEAYGDRLPRQLSGGQQQRVAVARALSVHPRVLLLDEPFGALDRALRADLQLEFVEMQRALGITTIMVTHDQEEAQTVADQLVVMNRGRIEQNGTSEDLYDNPRTLFVNGFMGQTNSLAATVERIEGQVSILRLPTGEQLRLARPLAYLPGSGVVVTCRPEHVSMTADPVSDGLAARMKRSLSLGPTRLCNLVLGDGTPINVIVPRTPGSPPPESDRPVFVVFDPVKCPVFPAGDGRAPSATTAN